MKYKRIGFVFLLLFVLILNGCNSTDNSKVEDKSEGKEVANEIEIEEVVVNLSGGDDGYPNPYQHYPRGPGISKMKMIYDSLLEKGERELIAWMAKDYSISEDGLEYTFELRDDLYWHDGEKVTAEDVEFSLDYYKKYPPMSNDINRSDNDYIENIEIDKNKIVIKITDVDWSALEKIGCARIIPKHIWENVDDPNTFDGEGAIIGSGPYKLEEFNREQGMYKFVAFEDYWATHKAHEVNFIPVSDGILAFENQDIDLVSITPDLFERYENNEEFKIVESPPAFGYRLFINMEKRPELADRDIRQAIMYGIDNQEILDKARRGAGAIPSSGFLSKTHSYYSDKTIEYDLDIEKAKELLNDKNYSFELLVANTNQEARIGEIVKLNLEKIGIDISIKSMDSKSRDSALNSMDYELGILQTPGRLWDPNILMDNFANIDNKKPPIPGYNNETINRLAVEQSKEPSLEKRKDLVLELQEEIGQEAIAILLVDNIDYVVYRPNKYNGWTHVFDHHSITHNKLSFIKAD